jgi:hypothetical protein
VQQTDQVLPRASLTTTWLFAFPAQAAANNLTAVLDWLGSADLSCRPINAYGPERRAEPHNLSLFALLILFDIACHAARTSIACSVIIRTCFGSAT